MIARYRARIPELMAEQDIPGLVRCARRRGPGPVDRGLRSPRSRRLRSGHRRHDLQRPVDVEAVHRDGRHAGRPGRPARPRRADHDLPPGLHRPQCVRGASRAEDHAPHAAEPHRRLHPRGADRQQLRARPGHFRRARPEHLRHLAPIPGRDRLRLLEPRHRPRGLHPRAGLRRAVRGRDAGLAARAARHGPQHVRPGRDPAHCQPRASATSVWSRGAARRADDGGRWAVHAARRTWPGSCASS